ncbi:MAG: YbfB/YjiJ family MFS transporter [Deferribacterales bacterium]
MKITRMIAAGIAAMITSMGLARFSFTPMINIMAKADVLSVAHAGELASLNYAGYLFGSVFFMLYRTYKKLTWFYTLYAVNALTLLMMPFSQSYSFWAVLRTVSGFASAGMFILFSAVVLEHLARQNKAHFAGLIYTGIGIGIFISGLSVLIMAEHTGWQNMWIVFFIESLALFPLCFIGTDGDHAAVKTDKSDEKTPMHPYIYFLGTAYFFMGAAYIVNGTFLVVIIDSIENLKGFGGYTAWMITGLSAIPGIVYLSMTAGRKGYLSNLIPAYVVLGISCILPAVSKNPAAVMLAAALYGATFLGIVSLTVAFSRKLAGSHTTFAVGLVTTAFGIGQMLGPVAAGYSAQITGSFSGALMISAVFCAVSIAILLMGCSIYRRSNVCRS